MNDNTYEQEFIKNVRQAAHATPPAKTKVGDSAAGSKLPLILSIFLTFVVLVESVALIVFAVNYAEVLDLYGEDVTIEYDSSKDSPEDLSEDSKFNYDSEYLVTAFDLECTAEDGTKYSFTKSGSYKKTDKTSAVTDSGSYSIVNGGAVVLNGGNNTSDEKNIVYYDGYSIMEGLNFYTCDE